jgi:hypothetical protein
MPPSMKAILAHVLARPALPTGRPASPDGVDREPAPMRPAEEAEVVTRQAPSMRDGRARTSAGDLDAAREARPGSNHAPPLDETPIEEITRIAQAMYGERWVSSVAKDTGEHVRQVRRWLDGTSQPSTGALRAVRSAARRHITRIQRALGE